MSKAPDTLEGEYVAAACIRMSTLARVQLRKHVIEKQTQQFLGALYSGCCDMDEKRRRWSKGSSLAWGGYLKHSRRRQ